MDYHTYDETETNVGVVSATKTFFVTKRHLSDLAMTFKVVSYMYCVQELKEKIDVTLMTVH